jgi:hypothetical protein
VIYLQSGHRVRAVAFQRFFAGTNGFGIARTRAKRLADTGEPGLADIQIIGSALDIFAASVISS